ncbi:Asp23/Gls24 family envelope stress response protein [Gordonia caeni]|uniref:Asp23/Gls24 family envelope stress response protein n=1 Tax=Gordonia caeni TaxID=1007097 RepID=A0ABP7NI91_9ACTN
MADELDVDVPGRLILDDKVGETIAVRAALDVDAVVSYSAGMGSLLSGPAAMLSAVGGGYPRARIDMSAALPRLSVEVALEWPCPVTRVCRDLREHLTDELMRLTGVRPVAVDVDVVQLVPRAQVRRRRAGLIEIPAVEEPAVEEPA